MTSLEKMQVNSIDKKILSFIETENERDILLRHSFAEPEREKISRKEMLLQRQYFT